MKRYLRLDPTIQRNMAEDLLRRRSVAVLVLGAHQLGGSDRHDGGSGRRTFRQDHPVTVDVFDDDLLADERRAASGW